MTDTLRTFTKEYGGKGTEVSKFRKYRHRSQVLMLLGIVWFWAGLLKQIKEPLSFIPYIDYTVFLPTIILILLAIFLRKTSQDLKVDSNEAAYYDIAAAINSKNNDDIDQALDHIRKLKKETSYNNNTCFSKGTEQKIEEYYERLNDSESPDSILDKTFEDFFTTLVNEIEEEDELGEILGEVSAGQSDEFEGSVLVDAFSRLELGGWSYAAMLFAMLSLAAFHFIGKDFGYYTGILLLTVIQIISSQQ
jgi:hypothetical protein